jgi:hypothetical protein
LETKNIFFFFVLYFLGVYMGKNNNSLGLASVVAGLTAALAFIVLAIYTTLDFATILFITLGLAGSAGAIVSIEKGSGVGEIAGFVTLLLMLFFVSPYLPERAAFVFATPSATIALDAAMIPLLLMGIIAIVALIAYIGGNVYRFSLWLLTLALTLAWFTYSDAIARILISAIIAIIVFIPIESLRPSLRLRTKGLLAAAVAPIAGFDKTVIIDLTSVNIYVAYALPFLTFIALDPTNKINDRYRGLASVVVLFMIFIQLLSYMFQLV